MGIKVGKYIRTHRHAGLKTIRHKHSTVSVGMDTKGTGMHSHSKTQVLVASQARSLREGAAIRVVPGVALKVWHAK